MSYTVTPTNRVLIEARFGERREEYAYTPDATRRSSGSFIPVVEQGGSIPGLLYRGRRHLERRRSRISGRSA